MTQHKPLLIYGEALFDCFFSGEQVLGGAPFNVAWHMQALGDNPRFVSRVGNDRLGQIIVQEMLDWGMDTSLIQHDPLNPTGRVTITLDQGQPAYDIAIDSAWDYIEMNNELTEQLDGAVLYHGSLATRSPVAQRTLDTLSGNGEADIFMDVNLRDPWWEKQRVFQYLEGARWVKLNQDELKALGFKSADLHQDMTRMHTHFHLDQLIVTCGENGAIVRDKNGEFHSIKPESSSEIIDAVGAGDAFTAIYLHGLLQNWSIADMLQRAQRFAGQTVAQRGAISKNKHIYDDYVI